VSAAGATGFLVQALGFKKVGGWVANYFFSLSGCSNICPFSPCFGGDFIVKWVSTAYYLFFSPLKPSMGYYLYYLGILCEYKLFLVNFQDLSIFSILIFYLSEL